MKTLIDEQGGYVNITVVEDEGRRTLTLTLTPEGREYLGEDWEEKRDTYVLYDLCEDHLANGWDVIQPYKIQALIDDTRFLLCNDAIQDDHGDYLYVGWVYDNDFSHMFTGYIKPLVETGKLEFTGTEIGMLIVPGCVLWPERAALAFDFVYTEGKGTGEFILRSASAPERFDDVMGVKNRGKLTFPISYEGVQNWVNATRKAVAARIPFYVALEIKVSPDDQPVECYLDGRDSLIVRAIVDSTYEQEDYIASS